jgi:hypothetical protein
VVVVVRSRLRLGLRRHRRIFQDAVWAAVSSGTPMKARRAFAISRAFEAAPLPRLPELLVLLQAFRDKMRLAAVAAAVFRLAPLELWHAYPSTVERRPPLL